MAAQVNDNTQRIIIFADDQHINRRIFAKQASGLENISNLCVICVEKGQEVISEVIKFFGRALVDRTIVEIVVVLDESMGDSFSGRETAESIRTLDFKAAVESKKIKEETAEKISKACRELKIFSYSSNKDTQETNKDLRFDQQPDLEETSPKGILLKGLVLDALEDVQKYKEVNNGRKGRLSLWGEKIREKRRSLTSLFGGESKLGSPSSSPEATPLKGQSPANSRSPSIFENNNTLLFTDSFHKTGHTKLENGSEIPEHVLLFRTIAEIFNGEYEPKKATPQSGNK